MRGLAATLTLLCLTSCDSVDYAVGPTEVVVWEGAELYDDLPNAIRAYQLALEQEWGTAEMTKIMGLEIHLYPGGWILGGQSEIACLYWPNTRTIEVRGIGPTVFGSSLGYEVFARRTRHVRTGYVADDGNLYWEQFSKRMEARARRLYRGP